jgi:hypothetical protein
LLQFLTVNRPFFLFLLALLPAGLHAQDTPAFDYRPATVVVFNSSDASSTELANYYIKQRGIPPQNLVGLKCQNTETITREAFQKDIELPLRAVFDQKNGGKPPGRRRMD